MTCYKKFFSYDVERATQLMLTVHYRGKGDLRHLYRRSGGDQSSDGESDYARENEHPLLCTLEKA